VVADNDNGPAPSPGYHIDVQEQHDRDTKRNKIVRWFGVIVMTLLGVMVPYLVTAYIVSLTGSGPLTMLVGIAAVAAAAPLEVFLWVRSLIYNPEWSAYVTQDAFTGNNVPYGPGLHLSFPWEERNASGNFSLRVISKPFETMVQTKTAKVKAKGQLQYQIDLSNITRFVGIDATTIESGFIGFLQSFLTGRYADLTAEEARTTVRETNQALCNEFMNVNIHGMTPADLETKYGIIVVTIMVSDLELPVAAQKARDAIDEAEAINKTVAALMSMEPKELAEELKSGKMSNERFLELLNRAMATSDNAEMKINVHEINLPGILDKLAERIGKAADSFASRNSSGQPQGT